MWVCVIYMYVRVFVCMCVCVCWYVLVCVTHGAWQWACSDLFATLSTLELHDIVTG